MKNTDLLIVALILALAGCYPKPDFPDTPEIAFKDLYIKYSGPNADDTLSFVVSFKDGNGDLGISDTETGPPYNRYNPDSTINPYYYNIYVDLFVKRGGEYEAVPFAFPLHGRFPRINESGENTPLEGIIRYKYKTSFFPLDPGDTIQAEITIRDRELHLSNTVRGPENGYVIPEDE
ncbi:hypothetical protein SAMN05421823_102761 [Catalinimonas alkaloidigena]|uniref:Lipoprotein n=1 Tax=Catalinimonas alkaloidigena TaxID=1075417 RepID=A0A1G9C0B6_9BACT|nr:hypothetical protein [Catalinimonas alkaloidigena]SDK45063.1 hypothetical protein SAMN05421823_102761 [Catalinimonas alkaloidigena]